jgi:hypothetical protein
MLFEPFTLRATKLSNRAVMSPLTRSRAVATTTRPTASWPPITASVQAPASSSRKERHNAPAPDTFYTPGAKGYTDYPALAG